MNMTLGNDLWAWMTEYPDGSAGLVGGMVPGFGHMPLIGRSEEAIKSFEDLARNHGRVLRQKVWIRHFTFVEDIGR